MKPVLWIDRQFILRSLTTAVAFAFLVLLATSPVVQAQTTQVSATSGAEVAPGDRKLSSNDYLLTFTNGVPSPAIISFLSSIPGLMVNQVAPQTVHIVITARETQALRRFLREIDRQGIAYLEHNGTIFPALVINDPETPWYLVEPTKVAVHPQSPNRTNPNDITALDLQQGSKETVIAVVDFNSDQFQDRNPDLPPPSFRFELGRIPFDVRYRHASATSAVIGSLTNNGIGMSGVCPGCSREEFTTFLAVTSDFPATEKFMHLLSMTEGRPIDVINMSWGVFDSVAVRTQIQRLSQQGKILVAAAGNLQWDVPMHPAAYPEVVAVGALVGFASGNYQRARYSNQGVDLTAVGTNIPIPIVQSNGQTQYSRVSGTSFAAPQVSGIAGLILSELKDNGHLYPLTSALDPNARASYVKELLFRTADEIGPVGKDPEYGHGVVNGLEAIRTLAADNSETIADDIPLRFSEWQSNSIIAAEPWLGLFQSTLVGEPESHLTVLRSINGGSCINDGYKVRAPRLRIKLKNPNLQVISANAETVRTRFTAEAAFELSQKIKISPSNPASCVFGWDEVNFQVLWSDDNEDFIQLDSEFQLTANGYTLVSPQRVSPAREFRFQFPNTGVSNLHGIYNRFLVEQIEPALELLQDELHSQLFTMTERVINKTLSFTPFTTAEYSQRRIGTTARGNVFLPNITAAHPRTHFEHDIQNGESVSDFGVRIAKSEFLQDITPSASLGATGDIPTIPTNGASQVTIPVSYYDSFLQNLYAQGHFSSRYTPDLQLDLFTETLLERDGITVTGDISAVRAPYIEYRRPLSTDPYYGDVVVPITSTFTVTNTRQSQETLRIGANIRIPVSKYDVYKQSDFEKNPEGLSFRYENRLTPDPTGTIVEILDSTGSQFLTHGETEVLLAETAGYLFSRKISAISSWQTATDKDAGRHGCILSLGSSGSGSGELLLDDKPVARIDDVRNCWNVSLQKFAVQQAPSYDRRGTFETRDLRFVPRYETVDPIAVATYEFVTEEHPATIGTNEEHLAGAIEAIIEAPRSTEEVHTSLSGVAYTPFQNISRERVRIYEHLWQARFLSVQQGVRELSHWAPKHLNKSSTVSLVSIPRHREQKNIPTSCLPYSEFTFSYQRGAFPAHFESGMAERYEETDIEDPHDVWSEMPQGSCTDSNPNEQDVKHPH